jgi:hypothetical protein
MRWSLFVVASLLAGALTVPSPAAAQGTGMAPGTVAPRAAARQKREPTAGQMAARERMRKCAGEWKEAKAKGATGGLKWPKYWSRCNARLKGNSA